jgi:ankyrin repeat protein
MSTSALRTFLSALALVALPVVSSADGITAEADGTTPLHRAAYAGDMRQVRTLLQGGARRMRPTGTA